MLTHRIFLSIRFRKDQPVFNIRTMQEMLSQSVAARRFSMILVAVFAVLALIPAAVGIYGVISYSVAQRTREVGIRMALGAHTREVLQLVVRDGLKLVLVGVGIGLGGALLLTRLMSTLLFAVALIACYIPALARRR